MPRITEQDISTRLDEWLANFVPSSIEEGIEAVREKLRKLLTKNIIGLEIPPVRAWIDYDDKRLVLFTYSSCTYLECCRGTYLVDTRYWNSLPEED